MQVINNDKEAEDRGVGGRTEVVQHLIRLWLMGEKAERAGECFAWLCGQYEQQKSDDYSLYLETKLK